MTFSKKKSSRLARWTGMDGLREELYERVDQTLHLFDNRVIPSLEQNTQELRMLNDKLSEIGRVLDQILVLLRQRT